MEEEEEEGSSFQDVEELMDIDAEDPLEAIIKIDRRLRPPPNLVIQNMDQVAIVNRYYAMMKHACELFGVEFDLNEPFANGRSEGEKLLYLTRTEIDKRKLDRLH